MSEGNKSLKKNMVLNAIKGIMSIIFPLITFPYVSKVLGVDNLGRYNFANSVISYIVLLAGLGISTYAIREGARIRENISELECFADEMFSINMISTFLSYVVFFVLLITVPKFQNYKSILLILSLQAIFKTIGIEWIYSVFEDYAYITKRSIVFQLISLALLFLFVKDQNDVNVYAAITVFSVGGSGVINFFHARKYCKVGFTWKIDWSRHVKPIMILFATAITTTIYVSSDTTLLGFLCDDYVVGIYSVSAKIYTLIKSILSSIVVVSIPRLSSYLGNELKSEFDFVASDIYKTLLTVVLPAATGIIILREPIIMLISDYTYISASSSLFLLSISLIFCLGAAFWGQCILVPSKMEGTVFKATLISAIVNLSLNLLLIPIWKENGAAITTILAEGIAFVWCWYKGRHLVRMEGVLFTFLKVVIGCACIVYISLVCNMLFGHGLLYTIFTIIISIGLYAIIEILLRNDAMWSVINSIRAKYLRKHN